MSALRCTGKNCIAPARWHVGWKAYALGYPRVDRNSVSGWFRQYVVCDACRSGIEVQDLLLPAGKERINGALLQAKRALLDFTTAELSFRSVDEGLG